MSRRGRGARADPPAVYHRIVVSGRVTEEVHRLGRWLITGATMSLTFGLSGDLYVVLTKIVASARIGALIAGAALRPHGRALARLARLYPAAAPCGF